MRYLTLMVLVASMAGCATAVPAGQARVTLESSPPGAWVTVRNKNYPTPVVLTIPAKPGYFDSIPVVAKWPSGVSNSALISVRSGQDTRYTMQRPSLPGLAIDAPNAVADARRRAQDQEIFTNALRQYNNQRATEIAAPLNVPGGASPTSANCISSRTVGGIVNTSCTAF